MARTTAQIAASSSAIWNLLADGWLYASWVVGTVKIRSVDEAWPAVGSKLHHSVGAWPLMLHDETEITECEPGRRLVMQARGWPVGEATVELVLVPDGSTATTVQLAEAPTAGPGSWANNPLFEAVAKHRLEEMLARLARIAEGHHQSAP